MEISSKHCIEQHQLISRPRHRRRCIGDRRSTTNSNVVSDLCVFEQTLHRHSQLDHHHQIVTSQSCDETLQREERSESLRRCQSTDDEMERERERGRVGEEIRISFFSCVCGVTQNRLGETQRKTQRERRAKIEFEFHHSRSVFRLNNDDHFVIGFFLSLFKKKTKKKTTTTKERVGTESTSAHA